MMTLKHCGVHHDQSWADTLAQEGEEKLKSNHSLPMPECFFKLPQTTGSGCAKKYPIENFANFSINIEI